MADFSEQVNALLSDPKSMEKIMSLAGMLSGNAAAGAPDEGGAGDDGGAAGAAGAAGLDIDPAMLMRITKALGAIKKDDPRVDLLLALRPNLSEARRKRVDEAVQILRLVGLVPMLREEGFLNF